MFGIEQALIRMARQVVQNVTSQLTQQLNVVQNQALQPMRMMVQQVMGGIWIGEGANAFVEEVSSLMIPGVGQVMDQISTTTRNINHAVEVIDEADKKVQSMVNSLSDVFSRIY
ncbi:MAG: hypothetical protein IPM07_07360 [Anaerolineales bacterium]|nr:hypothetical protein [Anaerolineales bacterium]